MNFKRFSQSIEQHFSHGRSKQFLKQNTISESRKQRKMANIVSDFLMQLFKNHLVGSI
jgi:hypothetical protein